MSKEHRSRGAFNGRERPFDWRGLAEAYGIAEQDVRELYEEAMRRAGAYQEAGRHQASIYVDLLEQVRSGVHRPAPGKVTRMARLAGVRQRCLQGEPPAPGKVALTSYLHSVRPPAREQRHETWAEDEMAGLLAVPPGQARADAAMELFEACLALGTRPNAGRESAAGGEDAEAAEQVATESAWRDEAAPLAARLGVDPEIRADDEARERTEARGARGLATESAIYLHPKRIAPGTSEGRRVLIHELVHVAQARKQSGGRAVADRAAAEAEAAAAAEQRLAPPAHAIDLDAQAAADVDADPAPTPAARRPAKGDDSKRPDLTRTPYRWVSGTYRLWVKKAWFTGASDFEITGRGWCAPSRSREILAHLRDQGVLEWARPGAIARAAERIGIAPLTSDVAEIDLGAGLVGSLGLPPGVGATARRGSDGDLEVIVALTGPAAALRGEFPLSPAHLEQVVAALERATSLPIEGSARVELGGAATRARLASGRAHTPVSRSELERWFGAERYRSWLDRAPDRGQDQEPLAVQARGRVSGDGSWVRARAAEGVAGSSSTMPYRGEIQAAFGRHDVGTIEAHVGGAAADAAAAIGAEAYATGEQIAFGGPPDLHTAAHEAAHVVQQRGGVELAGGVGRAGDAYERHADAVADRVVAGRSAEALLDQMAGGSSADAVQLRSDHATVQLDKGEAAAAEDRVLANLPAVTMSVQFSGLVFTPARGTTWVAGIDKSLLAHAMAVKALVGEAACSPELARQTDRYLRSSGGWTSGVGGRAVQGEEMRDFRVDPALALELVTFLRDAKKLHLTLGQDRIDKLLLGNDIKDAWFFIKNVEPPLPPWYGQDLFWDQILAEQYKPLILEFRAKVTALDADRNAKTKAAAKVALNALVAPLRPDAELLERVRRDASLTSHEGYRKLWRLAPVDPARPKIAPAAADAAVDTSIAARFLQQAQTNRAAGAQAREDGPEGSKARRTLLDGMQAVADVVDEKEDGASGDAELRSTESRANAPPLPSMLRAYPALPYPHTRPGGTTHTFTMNVQYPSHTLEALGALFDNVYTWETIRVPNESFDRLADTAKDEKTKGYRPSFTAVAGQAAARQWGYLDADQQRVRGALEGLEVILGPMMVGVESLLVANRAIGAIGKVVQTAIHELFEPSDQETVLFDQEPGLYVVRCRVHRRAREESQLVRADSVAWHAVLVREPQKVANEALEGQLRGRSNLDQRLKEIEAELASGSVSDPKEVAALEEEGASIRIALYGSVEGNLVAEQQTLEKRRRELQSQRKAGGGVPARAVAQELEQIEKRLDEIAEILKVRRVRHEEHTASGVEGPVKIPAAFVGDEGNVLSLVLEAIEQPRQDGKFVYHVTDATTKDSSQATGNPQGSRADAIADAVKCLLEKASGYGQGYVTIHVPAPGGRVVSLADGADAAPHMRQIRIESDLTAIAMSGIDNIATALSIAAVVAAPLTGGASLAFLVPIGAVGAIPSAYRILDRAQSGTLRMDLDTAMDIVNVVGGAAGIGQLSKVALRCVPLGRGFMMIGVGSDRLGVALAGARLIEDARNIDPNAPPGVRLAMLAELIGGQLIDMGIEGGTALARRGQALKAQHAGAGADAGLKLGSPDLHLRFHAAAKSDVPIFEDTSLAANTAVVRHDLDGYGLVTNVRLAMAPGATPDAVLEHAPAVEAIGKFARAQGLLRNLIDRGTVLGRVSEGQAAASVAKVRGELDKLPAILRQHQQQAADGKLDPGDAEGVVGGLLRQMERHERAFDKVDADLSSLPPLRSTKPGGAVPPSERETVRSPAAHDATTDQIPVPPHEAVTDQIPVPPHEATTQQVPAAREPYVPVKKVVPVVEVRGPRAVLDDLPDLKNLGALPESVLAAHQVSHIEPALQSMSDGDYIRFRAIAASLPDPVARGYLYKALASSNSLASIEWLADELAGKGPDWMADNLTLTSSRGVGGGLVQQWSHSCNAATAIVLRGAYDPVFALRLRYGNIAVGGVDMDDPEKGNLHQAAMERDMLESPYVGDGWWQTYGYGHVGRPKPRNKETEGVGRMGDDLFNRQAKATGLEFDSTVPTSPREAIAILDQALSQGMQVPVILGTPEKLRAHYVLCVERRVRQDGGLEFRFHNVGDGTTTWVTADQIANGNVPLAGGNKITGIEKPRAYVPPRPTRPMTAEPASDSATTPESPEHVSEHGSGPDQVPPGNAPGVEETRLRGSLGDEVFEKLASELGVTVIEELQRGFGSLYLKHLVEGPAIKPKRLVKMLTRVGLAEMQQISQRVADLKSRGVKGDLNKIERDALGGQLGAQGELDAMTRWLDEGKAVEALPEIQNAGTNPDFLVDAVLTEVKTTKSEPIKKTFNRLLYDANKQMGKRAGATNDSRFASGELEIQFVQQDGRPVRFEDVQAELLREFLPDQFRSLSSVKIYVHGTLLGHWRRSPEGSIVNVARGADFDG